MVRAASFPWARLGVGYPDGVIDQDSYQAATKELVLEKTTLKKEKERVQRTRTNSWIEPAKAVVNTLALAGKAQSERTAQETAQIVHKVGTNRLIARKTMSFALAEPYDFIPSLLGNINRAISDNPSLTSDFNWWSTVWCAREDLNLQSFQNQILSLARLPIPPRAHIY
jgi:hypothetical protein